MEYIAHKRFKDKAICGLVNIPAMSVCQEVGGLITYQGKPICYVNSSNAHRYFARNDDLCGLKRGALTTHINKMLGYRRGHNVQYQERWNKVWNDDICKKYKRQEHEDHWLWNHAFYNASIEELTYIARLIGATK